MGPLTDVFGWITSPSKDNTTIDYWLIGLVAILALSFLWAEVVDTIGEM
ncbi:MAG: hypothetical protein ACP5EP_12270 [Acidobacteriaceae bacterium]